MRRQRCLLTTLLLATAFLLLAIGGAIYLLFRPQTLVMFCVADSLRLGAVINQWRAAAAGISLPEWTIYSLPNALWTAAYILTVDTLLRGEMLRSRLWTAALMPLLGVGTEILQTMGIVPGTFDWLDIAAYALPYLTYVITIDIINKYKKI